MDHPSSGHRKNVDGYSEEKVKGSLVVAILNQIDFTVGGWTDWDEIPPSATFGKTTLSGTTDDLITRGKKKPIAPFVFLQRFRPNFANRSPEVQLVAEMVTTTALETCEPPLRTASTV